MSRKLFLTAFAVSLLTNPAVGAEILSGGVYGGAQESSDFLRDSYPSDWDASDNGDPLDFEIGMRYFYSLGSSKLTVNGGSYSSNDQSHIVELHARIDDNSTDTFLKGSFGYAAVTNGTYETPEFIGVQTMNNGSIISYGGADFGYMPFGNADFRLGGFVGYQYLADNVDMGRSNYVTASGGGDSDQNAMNINALKLGVVARAELADMIDLNIEAAVIPYANISGTYGAFNLPNYAFGGNVFQQGSAGTISGNLYGASGEAMIGFHPTEDITLRVGGRVTYLTGDASISYTGREVGTPTNSQDFISEVSGLEFFRYGALLELTARF